MANLYQAFASIKTEKEFNNFLRDICTPDEIKALNNRWKIAQLLFEKKLSQSEIAEKLNTGLATVSRVARSLNDKSTGGYHRVISNTNHA
ncbi:MAG: YerC/YecD family TrpR-related protein [Alphaproteobacteria bacterium]|nr:YerC/YecD family TrpR-related protein [Alphaproteobacteria bacterium]